METARSRAEAKLQERRIPKPTNTITKARQIHSPHKDTKRDHGFRQSKFQTSSAITTLIEKRNASKFCEFHREVGHTTDECMHLKRQIKEMLKSGKLSHLIKELRQSSGKDQVKVANKSETSGKKKPLAILMVQPWQRVAKQKITQTLSLGSVISFSPLRAKRRLLTPEIKFE
nr:reverse transcriptase domain-containing protein [Tanacetum cinerariifolium]